MKNWKKCGLIPVFLLLIFSLCCCAEINNEVPYAYFPSSLDQTDVYAAGAGAISVDFFGTDIARNKGIVSVYRTEDNSLFGQVDIRDKEHAQIRRVSEAAVSLGLFFDTAFEPSTTYRIVADEGLIRYVNAGGLSPMFDGWIYVTGDYGVLCSADEVQTCKKGETFSLPVTLGSTAVKVVLEPDNPNEISSDALILTEDGSFHVTLLSDTCRLTVSFYDTEGVLLDGISYQIE